MKKLYLIGGGGHCLSCIDVIESEGKYAIAGILDLPENIGKKVLNYDIVGSDSDFEKFISNETSFLITLGQIKSAEKRINLFENLKKAKANMATAISPRAHVSKYATVGEGTIVMHDALVNTNAQIGVNCIINTKSLIEHDSILGKHCHASTASVVNGNCIIGDEVFIGSNAVLKHGVKVESKTIVQAGSFFNG